MGYQGKNTLQFTSKTRDKWEGVSRDEVEEAKQRWLAEHQVTRLEPGYSRYGFEPIPVKQR